MGAAMGLRVLGPKTTGRPGGHFVWNIVHFQAEVMKVFSALVELFGQRVIVGQRFHELEIEIAQIQVREANPHVFDDLAQSVFQTKGVPVELEGLVRVSNQNCNVV